MAKVLQRFKGDKFPGVGVSAAAVIHSANFIVLRWVDREHGAIVTSYGARRSPEVFVIWQALYHIVYGCLLIFGHPGTPGSRLTSSSAAGYRGRFLRAGHRDGAT
jgi:hypothetical protein